MKVKRNICIGGLLLILVFMVFGCNAADTVSEIAPTEITPVEEVVVESLPTQIEEVIVEEESPEAPEPERMNVDYSVVLVENQQNAADTDIYLLDEQTGNQQLFLTITDVYSMHYHAAEFHAGNVYLIKRIGYDENAMEPDDEWIDELWKYDQTGNGQKLYQAKGFDFRVAANMERIAIVSGDFSTGEKFQVLDSQGTLMVEMPASQFTNGNDDFSIGLMDWSSTGNIIWIRAGGPGPAPLFISRVYDGTYQVDTFDLTGLSVGQEFDLNTDQSLFVFSDMPAFFEVNSYNEFVASGKAVTLYLYSLETQALEQIAVSSAKEFGPVWLDATTVEYDDPVGEGRLTYSLP